VSSFEGLNSSGHFLIDSQVSALSSEGGQVLGRSEATREDECLHKEYIELGCIEFAERLATASGNAVGLNEHIASV